MEMGRTAWRMGRGEEERRGKEERTAGAAAEASLRANCPMTGASRCRVPTAKPQSPKLVMSCVGMKVR